MAEVVYGESSYRFTDPIRYFKANDPYYYEIDNVPLRQLQENTLWLKDQLTKGPFGLTDIRREDFSELRPYANGADRKIRVRPGRYSARINDAYSDVTKLQVLNKIFGDELGQNNAFSARFMANKNDGTFSNAPIENQTLTNMVLQIFGEFGNMSVNNSMDMNGMAERAFAYPTRDEAFPLDSHYTSLTGTPQFGTDDDGTVYLNGLSRPPFPTQEAVGWVTRNSTMLYDYLLPTYDPINATNGFLNLPSLENALVKRWRGIFRWAIVDLPEEASITIPDWDVDDFKYTRQNGSTGTVPATQRIDLVFLYSKPVDASSTTILRGGQKETITKPALGLVKGAGLGINLSQITGARDSKANPVPLYDSEGNYIMLQGAYDSGSTTNGFQSSSNEVHGSFPAPDDLINLSPALSNRLEGTEWELIGQTILPLAYVVVNKDAAVNDVGIQYLDKNNVLDIRPFFRTAELAYNERAGIGAAYPPLSLANPAVGKAEVDLEVGRLRDKLEAGLRTNKPGGTRIVSTGYVFGGWAYGPEATLMDYYKSEFGSDFVGGNNDDASILNYIKTRYKFGGSMSDVNIPLLPDWDIAKWCALGEDIENRGYFPNDRIETVAISARNVEAGHEINGARVIEQATGAPPTETEIRARKFGVDWTVGGDGVDPSAGAHALDNYGQLLPFFNTHFVKKTIHFDAEDLPWMEDYDVDVKLLGCLPMTFRGLHNSKSSGGSMGRFASAGGAAGIWVDKAQDHFTIYVAWQAQDHVQDPTDGGAIFPAPHARDIVTFSHGKKKKKTNKTHTQYVDRSSENWAGFMVATEDLLSVTDDENFDHAVEVGVCNYPTVSWSLTVIPKKDAKYINGNLNAPNPRIRVFPGQL